MNSTDRVQIQLPYLLFGDDFPVHIKYHDINPLDEDKRLRVFGGQLMDTIVENTSLSNYNFNIGVFFKQGTRLVKRYPHRETELNKDMIVFWTKMQSKYKELKDAERNNRNL